MNTIILASNSKARLSLLEENGFKVIARSTNIDETSNKKLPQDIVIDLARQKLEAYFNLYGKENDNIILAADTMIYFKNQLIGKANNKTEAYNTLKSLSNEKHQIYSSYALYIPSSDKIETGFDVVDVKFKNLSDLTIMNYLICNEWKGAAGSYRIQGKGKTLVEEINGDFNVAVGLPLKAISALI